MRGFWNSKYIDFWSAPHFLFGVLLGQVSRAFQVSLIFTGIAVVLVAILWEIFERIENIPEEKSNGIVDVVLAIFGFAIITFIVTNFSQTIELVLFWVVLGLYILLNVGGFLAGGWRSWFCHNQK